MDAAAILAEVTPVTRTVAVCVRGDLTSAIEELDEQLRALRGEDVMGSAEAKALAEQLEALEAEAAAHTYEFRFEPIGTQRWRKLAGEHPPTEEQQAINRFAEWDVESFPSAAIAASCAEPAMTVEQALQFEDRLSLGQWRRLWGACLAVNMDGGQVPKSVAASSVLAASELS